MKITVFGIGYVGLVQAAVLAEVGHDVICVDIDKNKINNLKKGVIPFFEPGLANLVTQNYKAKRLKFTLDAKDGVNHGEIQFIAVGTPEGKNGLADLKYITTVVSTIAYYMNDYKVIINKSTAPVGTIDLIRNIIKNILKTRNNSLTYDIVSNPEFLREGAAVMDCMSPDRIIIGLDNIKIMRIINKLYKPFKLHHNKIIFMDNRSAELTKYASNCMLATKISFINEISNIAELLGADIEKVRKGIGSDSRIGYNFIHPGCGYGGSCFPKDMRALISAAKQVGYQADLLQAVENVNYYQKNKLFMLIRRHFGNDLSDKKFALWGLSFKPNTDDIRESSSLFLMEILWKYGAIIQAFDPKAMNKVSYFYGYQKNLKLMNSKEDALFGADALIICTEWKHFRVIDLNFIKSMLKQPIIFDGRNLYDPKKLLNYGFIYYGIGRGASINS